MSYTQPSIPAIVLAGSRRHGDPLADHLGIEHKCLALIDGVPMITTVVTALRGNPRIGRIIVAVNDLDDFAPALDGIDNVQAILCAPSPSLSVIRALEQIDEQQDQAAWPVLLTTGDHALLDASMVDEMLDGARGDIAVGLVERNEVLKAAPKTKRTYLRFKDGQFSGANLFVLQNSEVSKALAFWRHIEQERKKPWRLAKAFGFKSLLLYLCGMLSLDAAMRRISKILGVQATAVRLMNGCAAIDVDKQSDLELVQTLIANRRSGG